MNLIPKGIILSCEGCSLTVNEKKFFSKTNPFGFILFSRNFESKKQIIQLIKSLKISTKNLNPLIFVDQEGGRVQRLRDNGFTKIPPQSLFGEIFEKNAQKAKKLAFFTAQLIGCELKEIGIDVNCSPVLDILFDFSDPIIGDRSFSSKPNVVSQLGNEYCEGYRKSGIIPLIKHFPGHGRATVDSHKKLPIVNSSITCMKKVDIVPFKYLKNQIFLMLAHIVYSDIDCKVAPYSKIIKKEIIEDYLNFKGLIISDDLDMQALKGNVVEKTNKCYDGGCDIVLYCAGKLADMEKIYKNSKTINKNKYSLFKNFVNCLPKENIKKDKLIKYLRNSNIIE